MTPRPTSPITAWDVPIKHMDVWKARGINVLVGCGLEVPDTVGARLAWAVEAAKRDLWVCADFLGNVPANTFAFLLPDELDAKQADPNIQKWDGRTHDQIRPLYDAFKKLAPTIPVLASLSGDHIIQANRLPYYQSIADCSDIWSEDFYPFSIDPTRYTIMQKALAVAVLKQAAPNKPVWTWIETCWQHLKNRPNGRQITAAEYRATVAVMRTAGVAGRGHFSHVFNGNGGWVSFDGTPTDVAQAITEESAKDSPAATPVPPVVSAPEELASVKSQVAKLQQQVDDQGKLLADTILTAGRAKAAAESANAMLAAIGATIVKPANP